MSAFDDEFGLFGDEATPEEEERKPTLGARKIASNETIIDDIEAGLKGRYEAFLAANGIEVAGIEFIRDADGTIYTYDVNTNTNYNPEAEARAGRSAMTALARFLGGELARVGSGRAAAE